MIQNSGVPVSISEHERPETALVLALLPERPSLELDILALEVPLLMPVSMLSTVLSLELDTLALEEATLGSKLELDPRLGLPMVLLSSFGKRDNSAL